MTVFLVVLSKSYAYFEEQVEGSCVTLEVGKLDQELKGKTTLDKKEKETIEFIIKNTEDIDSKYQLYYKSSNDLTNVSVKYSITSIDLPYGDIGANTEKHIKLVLENNSSSEVTIEIGVRGGLSTNSVEDIILNSGEYRINEMIDDSVYKENILNGTDPVLTNNLVPVNISENGTVTKADTAKEWYKYEQLRWANAVVLVDYTISYNNGDTIPESNIESYFVWIPRYKYKIFNLGSYTSLTSLSSTAVQAIEV